MCTTEEERTREEVQPSTSNTQTVQDRMVRNIVASVMESQAATITTMSKEAVLAVMSQTEEKMVGDIEARMKKKEKIAEPALQHEGNRHQYKHQKDLWEMLDDTEQAVKREDVKKALELIDQGKKLVQKRMKLIKIADREDWGTVKEYMSDNLASDTDDEKALAKAIKTAAAKREKRKKLGGNTAGNRRLGARNNFRRPSSRTNYDAKSQAACWSCGKIGHFQWQCFTNQIRDYPFRDNFKA